MTVLNRPLMLPCPDCLDGYATHEDRHAQTRQDLCRTCGGERFIPADTGMRAETSAPLAIPAEPVNEAQAIAATGARLVEDLGPISVGYETDPGGLRAPYLGPRRDGRM